MSEKQDEIRDFFTKNSENYGAFVPYTYISKNFGEVASATDINQYFENVLSDFYYSDDEKDELRSKTDEEKREFCNEVINADISIPDPEYLASCIKKPNKVKPLFPYMEEILNQKRKSYLEQFVKKKGWSNLLSWVRKFRESPKKSQHKELLPYVLRCMNIILSVPYFSPDRFDDEAIISELLYVITTKDISDEYYIGSLNTWNLFLVDSEENPIIPRIKKTLEYLKRDNVKRFWKFLSATLNGDNQSAINLVITFTKRLILLKDLPRVRAETVIIFYHSGYMKTIRDLKNPQLDDVIAQFDEDFEVLSSFSRELDINPFSFKSVMLSMNQNSKKNGILRSILLHLYNFTDKFQANQETTFTFLHNFLVLDRYFLANSAPDKQLSPEEFAIAGNSALINQQPIKIPYEGNNSLEIVLSQRFYYILCKQLKDAELRDYAKIAVKQEEEEEAEEKQVKERAVEIPEEPPKPQVSLSENEVQTDPIPEPPKPQLSENIVQTDALPEREKVPVSHVKSQTESIIYKDLHVQTVPQENYRVQVKVQTDDDCAPVDSKTLEKYKGQVQELVEYIKKMKNAIHYSNSLKFEQDSILDQLEKDYTDIKHYRALIEILKQRLARYEKIYGILPDEEGLQAFMENSNLNAKELEKKDSEINLLQQNISMLKRSMSQKDAQNEELNRLLNERNLLVNQLKNEQRDARKHLQDEISHMKDQSEKELNSLKQKMKGLEKDNSSIKEDVQQLTNTKLRLTQQLSDSHEQVKRHEDTIADITKQLNEKIAQLSQLIKEKDKLDDWIKNAQTNQESFTDDLKAQIEKLKKENENLKKEQFKLKMEMSNKEIEIGVHSSNERQLKRELMKIKKQTDTLQKKVNEYEHIIKTKQLKGHGQQDQEEEEEEDGQ